MTHAKNVKRPRAKKKPGAPTAAAKKPAAKKPATKKPAQVRRPGPRRRERRRVAAEMRTDVTRIEYDRLLDDVTRNADAIRRLEGAHQIQIRRCAELQAEVDLLKRPKQG